MIPHNHPGSNIVLALFTSLGLAGSSISALSANVLFFSEYVEGSSLNKALEIFNSGASAEDLAAGAYDVQIFVNGSLTPTATIALAGTVAAGDVYVVALDGADAAILAQADSVTNSLNFNGDDAIVLRKNTVVIDAIGQVGFDPGSEWGAGLTSTADNTLRRKSSVTAGDADASDAFDPADQWDGYATDTFDGLGSHATTTAKGFAITRTVTNTVVVSWPGDDGTNWLLEASTNLSAGGGGWTPVQPPFQTNAGTLFFTDTPSLAHRFYRLHRPSGQSSNVLFFSEYVEGSSLNKALEIFNSGDSAEDLAAGAYDVQIFVNGSLTPTATNALSGTVAAGDVYVVASTGANAAILEQADWVTASLNFNGDDTIVLRKNGVVIDAIGQIGFDPGSEWGAGLTSTADNTLRRKSSVTTGDADANDPFDPADQWDGYAQDTFDGLGSHSLGP